MSNFSERDYKEENRKLRLENQHRTEQLSNSINLMKDLLDSKKHLLTLFKQIESFLKELKCND